MSLYNACKYMISLLYVINLTMKVLEQTLYRLISER